MAQTAYNNHKQEHKPGGKEESDFWSYQIVILKCPVHNIKITRHTKKKSMVLSEGKSDTTESVPEKDLMVNMLDKDFKTAALDIPEN